MNTMSYFIITLFLSLNFSYRFLIAMQDDDIFKYLNFNAEIIQKTSCQENMPTNQHESLTPSQEIYNASIAMQHITQQKTPSPKTIHCKKCTPYRPFTTIQKYQHHYEKKHRLRIKRKTCKSKPLNCRKCIPPVKFNSTAEYFYHRKQFHGNNEKNIG